MATLTNENVTIIVSVLFGLIPVVWLFFYLIDGTRHSKFGRIPGESRGSQVSDMAKPFIKSDFAIGALILSFILFMSASILMIIYSVDDGTTANRINT